MKEIKVSTGVSGLILTGLVLWLAGNAFIVQVDGTEQRDENSPHLHSP